jgi:hypothetical protein
MGHPWDENSSFFHAMATHKKNCIVSITRPNGEIVTDHDQKANIF